MYQVGKSKKTWLHTVSADIHLVKVDTRDVQDRVKWGGGLMTAKANPTVPANHLKIGDAKCNQRVVFGEF